MSLDCKKIIYVLLLMLNPWGGTIFASPAWTTGTYAERLASVHQAGEADAAELERFLAEKPEGSGVSAGELATLKNDAVLVLLSLPQVSPTLAGRLMTLASDPQTEVTWRDYCVQFLGLGYAKWGKADAKIVAEYLLKVASQDKSSTGGSAIIALYNNVGSPLIGRDRVAGLALAAVKDKASSDALKITALQVCGMLGESGALPHARQLADSASPVRASAIAAIGLLGDRSDKARLRDLSKVPDWICRQASLTALIAIQKREKDFEKEKKHDD